MSQNKELDLRELKDFNLAFWSLGNSPTQQISRLELQEVLLHTKALYLLSDKIVGSSSFYFESTITRQITSELAELFNRGDILYFVDDNTENYFEHGVRKAEKSPEHMLCYQDKYLVTSNSEYLENIGFILRRPDVCLSDTIASLWVKDVLNSRFGYLWGMQIDFSINEKDFSKLCNEIAEIATKRGDRDFVWDYVEPMLKKLNMPAKFLRLAKKKLTQFYAIATAQMLGASLDSNHDYKNQDYIILGSRFDTYLFLQCLEILDLTYAFSRLSTHDLIRIKSSTEFLVFRDFYFALIDAENYSASKVKEIFPMFVTSE